jgi:hypothetical protein
MRTPDAPVRDLLDRAVAAGILTAEQAAAVTALDAPAPGDPAAVERRRGAVLAEVLGYVGGTLAVVAALFLGAELWDELRPWPRVLLLGAVAAGCGAAGAVLGGRDGAAGRLGGFLRAAAVVAVAGTVGVAADGLFAAEGRTAALAAAGGALVVAVVSWWWRPGVIAHVVAFGAVVATLLTGLDRLGDGTFDWGGPLLWGLGLAWLGASTLPPGSPGPRRAPPASGARAAAGAEPVPGARRGVGGEPVPPVRPSAPTERTRRSVRWMHPTPRSLHSGGLWRPAEPGWVLGALAVVAGPLFAQDARGAWLLVGAAGAAALVVVGVRARRPWVAAVGTGGVFLAVPLAVAELFDARLGPLVGILVAGLALVAAAVVLARRARR